jgi:hypothetical protein
MTATDSNTDDGEKASKRRACLRAKSVTPDAFLDDYTELWSLPAKGGVAEASYTFRHLSGELTAASGDVDVVNSSDGTISLSVTADAETAVVETCARLDRESARQLAYILLTAAGDD